MYSHMQQPPKPHLLPIVIFICGASTMILELVGSRIMAPYVGTSIYVWTNLIGVILAFLSLGYAWGGKLADQKPSAGILSLVILGAAVWVALIGLVYDPVLILVQCGFHDTRVAALAGSLVFFGVPSTLLGMVLPYAVKLKIHSLGETGVTVGRLYALSTIGSIAGTFLTGFVLLSYMGNTLILFILSALLVLASLAASSSGGKIKIILLAALTVLAASSNLLAAAIDGNNLVDSNTPYGRVWIYDLQGEENKTLRMMQINDELSSIKLLGNSNQLAAPYLHYYRLCAHFYPEIKKGLMLGGAGYSYPRDFFLAFPDALMDVVEIDPGVTNLAKKYFDLKEDPRLTIYHEDARTYLNRNQKIYNVIFSDVFRSSSIPFHLTTDAAVRKIYDALDEKGVFIGNVISSVEGLSGQFLRAEVATFKKFFPQVYIFGVQNPDDGTLVQNLIIVTLKSSKVPKFYSRNSGTHQYLQHLWIKPIPEDEPVLKDDFAPVERYSFGAINTLQHPENPILMYWKKTLSCPVCDFLKKKPVSSK